MTELEAGELAIAQSLDPKNEDIAGRIAQIEAMLEERTRGEVAAFCSYHRQVDTLKMKPWEMPPCWCTDADNGLGGRLRRRMLAAGVPANHPDPLRALGAA